MVRYSLYEINIMMHVCATVWLVQLMTQHLSSFVLHTPSVSCSFTKSPGEKTFEVKIDSPVEQFTRIWIQVLDRQDGSFLVRYRMYATYTDLHIHVLLKNKHVAKSPFILRGRTQPRPPTKYVLGGLLMKMTHVQGKSRFWWHLCVFFPL